MLFFIFLYFSHNLITHQHPLNFVDWNDEKRHRISKEFCKEFRGI